jgi:rare lipoprotein A
MLKPLLLNGANMRIIIILLFVTTLIIGCSSKPEPKTNTSSRYSIKQDKAPQRLPTAVETLNIVPKYEPYSRGGNKDYTVRGISYQVLKSATNFQQTGNASWYGEKFHGHRTSNGEVYNMYGLSAAHTQLPLPSFVKVTNLVNNKEVIVRVNDRGPFHPSRIIDLSYGAAHRLGMLNSGTTRVKIEVLTFASDEPAVIIAAPTVMKQPTVTVITPPANIKAKAKVFRCVVQVAASSNKQVAQAKLLQVATKHQVTSQLEPAGSLVRMQLGPLTTNQDCQLLLKKIEHNYPKAFIKVL